MQSDWNTGTIGGLHVSSAERNDHEKQTNGAQCLSRITRRLFARPPMVGCLPLVAQTGDKIMLDITNDVPMPVAKPKPEHKPRKKKARVSPALREAAKQYKHAYIAAYGLRPTLTYDGKWIRLQGMTEGVSLKRLKEMTTQLRNRAG